MSLLCLYVSHDALEKMTESPVQPTLSEHVYCPSCSYNLHHAPGDRCPECGYELAALRSSESLIPWTHRKERGQLRTFWQTVWLVIFRHRLFCCEYAKKPSYADARHFQLFVVLYVYVSVLTATVLTYWINPPWGLESQDPVFDLSTMGYLGGPSLWRLAYTEVWPVAALHVCLILFLIAVTGVPSYWFHPKSAPCQQQNNGIALSYYSSAPLALILPIFAIVGGLLTVLGIDEWVVPWDIFHVGLQPPWSVALVASVLICLFTWWLCLIRLARRTMPQVKGRAVLIGTLVPTSWLALAIGCLLILPGALLYVLVAIYSL